MLRKIGHITVFVRDDEEAIHFYTEKLGFELLSDSPFGDGFRWVTVAPGKQDGSAIVFVKADTEKKRQAIGKQAIDHVFLVVETDNIEEAYLSMKAKGVEFLGAPQEVPWGKEVMFKDLYGNLFDLVEPL